MDLSIKSLIDLSTEVLKTSVNNLTAANNQDPDQWVARTFDHELNSIFNLPYKRRTDVFRYWGNYKKERLISLISSRLKELNIENRLSEFGNIHLAGFRIIVDVNNRIGTLILKVNEEPVH